MPSNSVIHKAVTRTGSVFSSSAIVTTTLCGRNRTTADGLNSSANDDEVTCKFCIRRMLRADSTKERSDGKQ